MSEPYGPGWQPQNPQAQNPQQPSGWQPAQQPAGWPAQQNQAPTGWQPTSAQQSGAPWQQQAPQDSPTGYPAPRHPGWQPQPEAPTGWQPGVQAPQPVGGGKKSRTPLILTVVAVVVALLAGAGIYFFAIRDTKSTAQGQATPQAAASSLLTSLSAKDAIGVAAQLDPAEAALFSDLSGDILTELKRLGIIKADADPQALSGAVITTKDLTYAPDEEKINDRVSVVKLTGGTVTIDFDAAKLPTVRQGQGCDSGVREAGRQPEQDRRHRRRGRQERRQAVPDRHCQARRHLVPELVLHSGGQRLPAGQGRQPVAAVPSGHRLHHPDRRRFPRSRGQRTDRQGARR